ncbi:MAG: PGF-pre-PGF domain-containing protein, partial [Methanoregula sp.]|nr:PGF-pre-PGF domain-containing protein [Methanoregula sp.]
PVPTTEVPTIIPTTEVPTPVPTTEVPTPVPTTEVPTPVATTEVPTSVPTTEIPTIVPTTEVPTTVPTTEVPTPVATTEVPTPVPTTEVPTPVPTTEIPTPVPTTEVPTIIPTTEVPTPVPSPQSFADTSDGGSNSLLPETSLLHIPVPETVTQTVNVGGDSAISRVTVTGQDVSDVVVTAIMVSSIPDNVPQIDAPVYQQIEITPAHFTGISAATIEFGVPLSLIEEQHSTLADITLSRFHDGSWTSLNTNLLKVESGHAWYRAESPGFSLFAIVITNGPSEKSVVVMTPVKPERVEPVQTSRVVLDHPILVQTITPLPAQPVHMAKGLPVKTILFVILMCNGISGDEIFGYWW